MLNRLYYAVCGYYDVTVGGEHPQVVLDRLFGEKIRFWNVRKCENGLRFRIRNSALKTARAALEDLEKHGVCAVEFCERGLFFVLVRYKMRLGMFLGLLFGIFFIFLSTFFVWGVTIETNTTQFSERELFAFLDSAGVRPGALVSEIEDRNLSLAFQLEHPEFVFVSFNVVGTHCTAELMERTAPPEKQVDTVTSHLVASVGGIIESVEVYNGEPMVKTGDVVDAGDLLVSGAITLRAGGYRLVESRGKIMARTFRTFECEIPFEEEIDLLTGDEKQSLSLSLLGADLSLPFSGKSPFDSYRMTSEVVPLKLFERELPLTLKRNTYSEMKKQCVTRDVKTVQKLCYDAYETWLSSVLSEEGEVLDESFDVETRHDSIRFKAEVCCVENIALESPFRFRTQEETEK